MPSLLGQGVAVRLRMMTVAITWLHVWGAMATSVHKDGDPRAVNVTILASAGVKATDSAPGGRRVVIGYHVCNWGYNWHSSDGYK